MDYWIKIGAFWIYLGGIYLGGLKLFGTLAIWFWFVGDVGDVYPLVDGWGW